MPRLFPPSTTRLSRFRITKRIERILTVAVVFALAAAFFLIWPRRDHDPATGGSTTTTTTTTTTRWSLFGKPRQLPSPPPFYPFETTSAFSPVSHPSPANATIADLCASFPHHLTRHRIQPVLKMGHGENRATINAQFASVSACFSPDELLVFSDLAEDPIPNTNTAGGGHRAIDILSTLPASYRDDWEDVTTPDGKKRKTRKPNPDFENYDRLVSLARQGKLTKENDPARGKAGWQLDKYKFLAGVERAWQMRPGRDFYVFYESDTYVSWDNLFRLLGTLNPSRELYIGSPSPGRKDEAKKVDTWFANGGPGYVLSRGAMESLLRRRTGDGGRYVDEPVGLKWAELLKRDPCGDSVLGWALWNAGVGLSGFFPLFNVYEVRAMPYTERLWCQPLVTMHKLSGDDMVRLWRWENGRRELAQPLVYRDLFEFLPVGREEVKENWDNTVWDRLAPGRDVYGLTLDGCKQACEDSPGCMQWHYQGKDTQKCVLMRYFTHGVAREPETVEKKVPVPGRERARDDTPEGEKFEVVKQRLVYTSGWIKPKIDHWVKSHRCETPEWVYPSRERHY